MNFFDPAGKRTDGRADDIRMHIPTVIETSGRGERSFDLYSLLLRERIIFIGTPIVPQIADLITAQLLYLQREDPEKDIMMYLHTVGGDPRAGLAVYDTMQMLSAPVATVAVGLTVGVGCLLLAAGTKGKRAALPHTTFVLHQEYGQARGVASDIEIVSREVIRLQSLIRSYFSEHTNQPLDRITRDTDRTFYMDAQQAVDYGLIDTILTRNQPEQDS